MVNPGMKRGDIPKDLLKPATEIDHVQYNWVLITIGECRVAKKRLIFDLCFNHSHLVGGFKPK